MTARVRIRDLLREFVPWWLSDRHFSSGKTVGFRFLYSMVAPLDNYLEYMVQSLQAPWPGQGPSDALPYVGRTRGILRGQADTDDSYTTKLLAWLTKWAGAGSQRQLAIEIHEYLGNSPRVRVVNRAGRMTTVDADGTVTETTVAWDWDSVTNPDRSDFWSEIWIIVYPSQWANASRYGSGIKWGDSGGFGHAVTHVEVDAIKGLVAQWKSAHTRVRAVIWCTDSSLFDPSSPSSLPDGQWGQWSMPGTSPRVQSHRNRTSCRYWEL